MKEIILLKQGEMVLKGANRYKFEDLLLRNVRNAVETLGKAHIFAKQSTVFVDFEDENVDMDEAEDRLCRVFGAVSVTRAAVCDYDFDTMLSQAAEYLRPALMFAKSFKVVAKRADKSYPKKSPEIGAELGGKLLSVFPRLEVKMKEPEVTVYAEVREHHIFVHTDAKRGAGGLPCGIGGHGLLMLSGGLDSPVAGYMMARRGMTIDALYFESIPYTNERAREKVLTLARELCEYCGKIRVHIISLTHIQEQIRDNCEEDYFTLILRRFMMSLASRVAEEHECPVLVTGESLGQVASQTTAAMCVTETCADRPVFRPLIGMDKEDIVRISRKIGTFDTSILPYEDCCTVFTPRHPRTRPTLEKVIAAEAGLDREALIKQAWTSRFSVLVEQFEK